MAAFTSFLGAYLLFALQPLIGKSLLPIYGGGAGPWIACMLFFQLVLLGGYAYAHGLAKHLGTLAALRVHGVLALVSLGILCLGFRAGGAPWLPSADATAGIVFPPLAILGTMLVSAGLPLLMLASTSPLIQAAYSRLHPGRDPYRLYAVSNAGSLGGLLSYPFFVEPFLDLKVQAWATALLFMIYMVLLFRLLRKVRPVPIETVDTDRVPGEGAGVDWRARAKWIGLSALGTLWLCAVTNKITSELGSMPLLWIPPLAVYLVTFILVFETRWSFEHPAWRAGLVFLIAILAWIEGVPPLYDALVRTWGGVAIAPLRPLFHHLEWLSDHVPFTVSTTILAGAAGCLLAHARLAGLRPGPERLTGYYLCISTGGALGGLFVSIAGPLLLNQDLELGLVVAITSGLVVLSFGRTLTRLRWPGLVFGTLAVGLSVFTLVLTSMDRTVFHARDFFGSFNVRMLHPKVRALTHGQTVHGIQLVAEPLRQVSYFGPDSGIGLVLRTLNAERPALRVGIVGLGVGNTAAFGRPTDEYVFFEISPRMIDVSGPQGSHFSVLRNTPARARVLQGDGRILAASEAAAHGPYDVLLIDAFAGGHIPTHLLTVEALRGYTTVLKPNGLLVLHVSHNLPLDHQAGANLHAAGLTGLLVPHEGVMGKSRSGAVVMVETPSIYWIASPHPGDVLRPEFLKTATRGVLQKNTPPPTIESGPMARALDLEISRFTPWTDQRHGLSPLLLFSLRRWWEGEIE